MYVLKLSWINFFIRMFVDPCYCTKAEYGMLSILHGAIIVAKLSKMCGLYVLNCSTVIDNASLSSQDFYDKTEIWDYDMSLKEVWLNLLSMVC